LLAAHAVQLALGGFFFLAFTCVLAQLSYTEVSKEIAMVQHIDAPVPAQQARALYEGMALSVLIRMRALR
jgi:hypothetical protein